MDRRNFLKTSCTACAALGIGLAFNSVPGCAPLPIYETSVRDNALRVPVSLFAQSRVQIIRADELDNDIGLRNEDDGSYHAFLLQCTHAQNPLTYTGNGYSCSVHGSTFDEEGRVTHGPAKLPLRQLKTRVEEAVIVIDLE
ncbi:MAG TPA: Rieske 2Fe-2S domain-containing protein [Bacteroidota bacterium]|nr:Rieske 2Fe-2S domain-containing protein [Bacteroidota bacterium]